MTSRVRRVVTAIDASGSAFSEVHTETQVGERWFPDDPTSLAQDSPELADWRAQYGGALEAERNSLAAQVAMLTAERDEALAQVEPLQTQVASLQAQLDAILNPPGPDLSTVEGAKTYISSERYSKETGGITVGGQFVSTERDEIGHWFPRFYDAMMWTQGDPTVRAGNPDGLYPYKPKNHEPVILSAAQVMRAYQCMAWYINQCFAVEDQLYVSLNAGTPIADVLAQIPAAWPQTAFEWTPPA